MTGVQTCALPICNELLEFLGGLAMLVVGLYLFTNKASVQTSFFAGNLSLFGLNVNSGLVIIPFIIGVVWLFVKPGSFGAKLVTEPPRQANWSGRMKKALS